MQGRGRKACGGDDTRRCASRTCYAGSDREAGARRYKEAS
jgi:hypothetical protein